MSVWNRIGQIAKDVGGFVAAPAKFAWDIGTAPWNDDAHFNGIANTLATATKNLGTSMLKPIEDVTRLPVVSGVLNGINTVNQNLIREPMAALALAAGDTISGKGNIFDPNEWKKAYSAVNTGQTITDAQGNVTKVAPISFGQAVAGGVEGAFNNNFNIYDPAQRVDAFKNSTFGRFASGALDTGIQFAGDVTLGLGKGLKVLKASEYGIGAFSKVPEVAAEQAAKAAEDITKYQYGAEQNRWAKPIQDFTKNDTAYALQHPLVKSSNEPGLLAHMLGNSKDEAQTAMILRSSLGDSAALEELKAVRPDLTQAINSSNQTLDAIDKFKMRLKDQFGEDIVNHLWQDPDVIAEAKAAKMAAVANDIHVSNLLKLGAGGGSLTRTTGTLLQGVEDFVAKQRAASFYDKPVGNPIISFYQATPFHRMFQVISHAEHERPAGLVNLNDPNSYKEIVASLERGRMLKVIDDSTSKAFLDRYVGSTTPEARQQTANAIDQHLLTGVAVKRGLTPEHAMDIWQIHNSARSTAIQQIKEDTFMVDHDKSIVHAPVFESQTEQYHPMMDMDLMDRLLNRHNKAIALVGRTKDTMIHYADILQDAFKAAALLRGGYTIRNGIDSQLRIIASVGAMASVRHLGEGMKNIMFNKIPTPTRLVDGFSFQTGKTAKISDIALEAKGLKGEISALQQKINTFEQYLKVRPDDVGTMTEIGTLRNLLEEKTAIAAHHAASIERLSKKGGKARLGDGIIEHTTSDGQKYKMYDAFGGPLGDVFRTANSSATTFQRLADTNASIVGRKLSSTGIGAIAGGDKGYFSEWANTLNTQFANSTAIRKLAAGQKPAEVIDFLRHDPKGGELRQRLPEKIGQEGLGLHYGDVPEYVTKINSFLDKYLPAEHGLLRKKLANRETITEQDLRNANIGKLDEELPIIHGNVLKENIHNNSLISIRTVTDSMFKFLGSMPEDAWARHPLYRELYRDELGRRLEIAAKQNGGRLTPEMQMEVMSNAHTFAQTGVKSILFNIERRTNLATYLKYVSPFFSAQENAVKTWLRLGAENPVIINRGNIIWNSPNRAGMVTDQNGKPVDPGKTGQGDTIWLEMPNWTKRIPFFGPGIAALNQQGISKQSLDVIFGGGMSAVYGGGTSIPFNDVIPVGPYVAIPASELVKRAPQFEDVFKWALPFGPTQGPAYQGLMPAWVKRAQTLMAGQNSQEYVRTYQLIHTTELHKARDAGETAPTDAKIKQMTDDYYKMRIAANLILPYSPKFDSPYKFYMDKYRQYQQTYTGLGQADAQFLKDFGPTFFDFATSLSSNKTGALATQSTYAATKRYGDLVSSVFQDNPSLVGLITNNPADTQFSQAVYDWQYNTSVGPGTADTFRSSANAQDAEKQNQVKLGWIQYRNVMNQVDAILESRGLTSVNDKGAEDLKLVKQATVQSLSYEQDGKGNPIIDANGQPKPSSWLLAYNDPNGSKTLEVISGLTKITQDEKFMVTDKHSDNATWKSVATYLQVRSQLGKILAGRKAKTITAKANYDVQAIYNAYVQSLKVDAGFADIYDRYLSQDQVYYKNISDIAAQAGA